MSSGGQGAKLSYVAYPRFCSRLRRTEDPQAIVCVGCLLPAIVLALVLGVSAAALAQWDVDIVSVAEVSGMGLVFDSVGAPHIVWGDNAQDRLYHGVLPGGVWDLDWEDVQLTELVDLEIADDDWLWVSYLGSVFQTSGTAHRTAAGQWRDFPSLNIQYPPYWQRQAVPPDRSYPLRQVELFRRGLTLSTVEFGMTLGGFEALLTSTRYYHGVASLGEQLGNANIAVNTLGEWYVIFRCGDEFRCWSCTGKDDCSGCGKVDDSVGVGHFNSIAIGPSGMPHVSYYDSANGDLKYASYDGATWHPQTVDSTGDVGLFTSIAVDAQGHPHISYHDATNGALKYAWNDGVGWSIEIVDPLGDSGWYSSLALDAQGRPHIAYYDGAYEMVLYATRSDEVYPIDYVVAHWIDDDLDPDDPCQISLAQVLQGITWWAVDAVVPYTDGLTIDLLGILDLIAKWSDDVCIEPANGSQSIPLGKLLASSGASGSIEAVREMSVEGDRLAVSVTVRAKERIHGLALEEDLPEGWLLVPIDNAGATFKASTLEWLWLTVDAGETLTVRYELIPPGGESATEPGAVIGTIRAADPAFEKAVGSGKVPTGMPVSDKPLGVVAYPNPVRDVHTVTFEVRGAHAAEVERMRVEIYDLAGHLVYRSEDQTTSLPWHTENLTGEYLANGVYVYQASLFIDGEWRAEDVGKVMVLK